MSATKHPRLLQRHIVFLPCIYLEWFLIIEAFSDEVRHLDNADRHWSWGVVDPWTVIPFLVDLQANLSLSTCKGECMRSEILLLHTDNRFWRVSRAWNTILDSGGSLRWLPSSAVFFLATYPTSTNPFLLPGVPVDKPTTVIELQFSVILP
jgi:hypothetical protein